MSLRHVIYILSLSDFILCVTFNTLQGKHPRYTKQSTHTTSKCIVSEQLSGENETGELFFVQMKGKRKPLLIVSLLHCQDWVEIPALTTLTHPSTQTICTEKLLNTKYQDNNSRLLFSGKATEEPETW